MKQMVRKLENRNQIFALSSHRISSSSHHKEDTYGILLSAHQVAGGNVGVAKLFNQLGTLGSLARSGTTEDESDFGIAEDFLYAATARVVYNLTVHFCLDLCLFPYLTSNISNNYNTKDSRQS
jgi:hypothetical protein